MLNKIPKVFWFALLPVLLGLPFIGRNYFNDDYYHLLMAKGLLDHPLRPYDFKADDVGTDDRGWERGQPPRMVNPPLHHYLLAFFWKISGGRLWAVRLLSLLISGASAAFIYLLAQRFVLPPGPATALAVLTPVFWLSSYALLIDSTMLAFFLGGFWAWIEGLDRKSLFFLVLSGLLMGLAILTKYTAATVLLLAVLYWWRDRKSGRRPAALAALALPAAILFLWGLWNIATYGAVHLTESSKRVMQTFAWSHLLVFFTFFGGVILIPLSAWRDAMDRGRRIFYPVLAGAGILAGLLASRWGGFSPGQAALMTALAGGGALFFVFSAETAFRSRFPLDRFLWLWMALATAQMVYVMQWVAARYFLTLLPPAVFLSVRMWSERWRAFPARRSRLQAAWSAALLVFGGALAAADYLQAETGRWILRDVSADGWLSKAPKGYFLGDSFTGTGSALKGAGWTPSFETTRMAPGSLLLNSEVIMPRWWFRSTGLRPLARYEYNTRHPLRVMDNAGSAGFYASSWGALPFTFSRQPLDRYTLFEVTEGTPPKR